MLIDYLQPNLLGEDFEKLRNDVREGLPCSAFGLLFSQRAAFAATLGTPVLYIVSSPAQAERVREVFEQLTGEQAVYLAPKDDVLLYKKAFVKNSLYRRLTSLYAMKHGAKYIVATPESLLQLFPAEVDGFTLEKGGEYRLDELVRKLAEMGYRRGETLADKGSFALRGDILDIFPINADCAVRLDFFGDEVENIRLIDDATNYSEGSIPRIEVVSATDAVVSGDGATLIAELKKHYFKSPTPLSKVRLKEIADDLFARLETASNSDYFGYLLPIGRRAKQGVFDYLPEGTTVVFDESKLIKDNFEMLVKEHEERFKQLFAAGEVFDFALEQYCSESELVGRLTSGRVLALQSVSAQLGVFSPLRTYKFSSVRIAKYSMRMSEIFTDVKNWLKCGYRIIFCCESARKSENLLSEMSEHGIFCGNRNDFPIDFSGAEICDYALDEGFCCHEGKLVIIGSGDLFLKPTTSKTLKKKRNEMFSAPAVGDYAVHEVHGVGIVRGTKLIESTAGTKEYVAVEYANGDVLYVPVEQLDKLTKYLGDKNPALSKIGGAEFEKVKERVRNSIRKMSVNLKALYRSRQEAKGFVFSPDDGVMRMFEEAFEFDETEDQLSSIAEIKGDMESGKVMDRLLCGDVGFGKTEVAFRACFKAILDGKQVAFVAPTTILAQQHYNTAVERFRGFGVKIGLLNRFRTPAQQSETLKLLAEGKVDMVIGTHRLFGKDVKFRDLGLLVLDEEQRFGVEHKEKIKLMKTNVDTLTLTATPIPRTLHMSLTGIRDISTINTPPRERIPVQTDVVEQTDALLRDAITRELARDGQVFVLYNRVESIYSFAADLRALVPEAKLIVAHGQMPERELENSIMSFYLDEANVLVSTTIIENGIDLPNANTLIVIDADKLGLSTLYQLKGRVGRGNRLARAYFTFKPDKILGETAYKRLSAIMEYTEMGSGIKVAMRDLEIRGAGNVLGREQSGHMEKVGYELYGKILREELGERTGEADTELDMRLDAFIPDGYINNASGRMDCYKRIAEISDFADRKSLEQNVAEVYGEPPREVKNLMDIALFKHLASGVGCVKASVTARGGELSFASLNDLNNPELLDALDAHRENAALNVSGSPSIRFAPKGKTESTLSAMISFLSF